MRDAFSIWPENAERVSLVDINTSAELFGDFVERWQGRIGSSKMDESLGELLEVAEEFEQLLGTADPAVVSTERLRS